MGNRLPSTADVRPIEDVIEDCKKIFIAKLPGNKFVHAGWAAFCEAWREYEFSKGIVLKDELAKSHSDSYLWLHHGKYQAYAGILRKIADGLGVDNMKPKNEWTGPEVDDGEGAVGQAGS